MTELVVTLLAIFLTAFLGVIMARNKNRNTTFWGTFCALFGIFGLAILAIMGDNEE